MDIYEELNKQIRTRRVSEKTKKLTTELVEQPLRALNQGEILIEVLFVPIHGSFWLASHPDGIHPRYEEFLSDNSFVFGNGGVGRVILTAEGCREVCVGDYVSVMGHLPCGNDTCYACKVLHRYTECEFGEGRILGHGKGAPDGTFARYCILPESTCEYCFSAGNPPSQQELIPYMFGFLLADIRNAITRDPETLRKQRILLVGAGNSSHLAALLFLRLVPNAKIIVVDTVQDKLDSIVRIAPDAIRAFTIPPTLARQLNSHLQDDAYSKELGEIIAQLEHCMKQFWGNKKSDLVFDASSGNSIPLWANHYLLSPATSCIIFGFGSDHLTLNQECLQISGLRIMTSRGVGDLENRRESIELLRHGFADMIYELLINEARKLESLDHAINFIKAQHELARDLFQPPPVYLAPSQFHQKVK